MKHVKFQRSQETGMHRKIANFVSYLLRHSSLSLLRERLFPRFVFERTCSLQTSNRIGRRQTRNEWWILRSLVSQHCVFWFISKDICTSIFRLDWYAACSECSFSTVLCRGDAWGRYSLICIENIPRESWWIKISKGNVNLERTYHANRWSPLAGKKKKPLGRNSIQSKFRAQPQNREEYVFILDSLERNSARRTTERKKKY